MKKILPPKALPYLIFKSSKYNENSGNLTINCVSGIIEECEDTESRCYRIKSNVTSETEYFSCKGNIVSLTNNTQCSMVASKEVQCFNVSTVAF